MKPLGILTTLLAISLAKELSHKNAEYDDLDAAMSIELLKTDHETLDPAASFYNSYVPPSQRPPRPWSPPSNSIPEHNPSDNTWTNQNYVSHLQIPQNNFVPPQNNYTPPHNDYVPPQNNNVPPQNNFKPPQNDYVPLNNNYRPPQNDYKPPQNDYKPPQNDYTPPQNVYVPPQNNYKPPQNNYAPPQNEYKPQNDYVPPQNNYKPPQNNYNPPQNNYNPPQNNNIPPPQNDWSSTPSTTPVAVIKNEQTYGDNGNYKYEYQIADGTHVSEEGFLANPNTENESLVKRGFYSYTGADGKVYTVTYWADSSGFHAFGDHLPTPPPVPPAIQAALDQAAKEEAAKAEAEKNQQQGYPQQPQRPQNPGYYPQQSTQAPPYYPQQTQTPAYYPQHPSQSNYPQQTQQTYYPQQTNPQQSSYGK